jgi:transcriptional regulator with XRE-family HTH domain
VLAEMSARRWTLADLSRKAGIDRDTASDFLSGNRWPNNRTQGHIEEALEWPPGTLAAICDGAEPPPPADSQAIHIRRPDGITDDQWDEIRRTAIEFLDFQIQRASREP